MPVIEVNNLRKRYGDTVAVEEGEIFGILGPNGAGKTTTVECVEGLRRPDGGTVSVLGLDPRRDRAELTQRLGVQLQRGVLPDKMKVGEALALYSSFCGSGCRRTRPRRRRRRGVQTRSAVLTGERGAKPDPGR